MLNPLLDADGHEGFGVTRIHVLWWGLPLAFLKFSNIYTHHIQIIEYLPMPIGFISNNTGTKYTFHFILRVQILVFYIEDIFQRINCFLGRFPLGSYWLTHIIFDPPNTGFNIICWIKIIFTTSGCKFFSRFLFSFLLLFLNLKTWRGISSTLYIIILLYFGLRAAPI